MLDSGGTDIKTVTVLTTAMEIEIGKILHLAIQRFLALLAVKTNVKASKCKCKTKTAPS